MRCDGRPVTGYRRGGWVTSIDIYLVIDTVLLLLIGVGPKIALVPFVQTTGRMDEASKTLVVRKMLRTAGASAVILMVLGELLARLLHFSTGSLSIAGGIILVIITVTMVLGLLALVLALDVVGALMASTRSPSMGAGAESG